MDVLFVLVVALAATFFFSAPTRTLRIRRRVMPLPSLALVTVMKKARRP